MRVKKIAMMLLLSLILTLAAPFGASAATGRHVFEDTLGHWAQLMISWTYEEGILKGTSEKTFSPNAAVTRAMAATALYRLGGEKGTGTQPPFDDVAKGAYYADAVAWASENAIIKGTSVRTFSPDAEIKRQDFIVMLHRYNQRNNTYEASVQGDFHDIDQISEYAKGAMYWGIENKVLNGDDKGFLKPQHSLSRAECATILFHYDSIDHEKLYDFDIMDIDRIFMQNGDGQNTTLTLDGQEDEIAQIVEKLNNFDYNRKIADMMAGWSYSIRIYEKEVADPVLYITLDSALIRSGAIFYITDDEHYFDLDWFAEVIEKYQL